MSQFYLPKIETRSVDVGGKPTYTIKGYATTTDYVYPYKVSGNRTFKEFFTERALQNIGKKVKNQKIFVDVEHSLGTKESTKMIIEQLKKKTGGDFAEEIDYIDSRFKYSDIPMFKVEEISIDDKGLFVEVQGNPYYRDIDEEHRKYFDAIWSSLENGYINGMSLNMKPTETVQINNDLTQIDNIDIYGISLTGSPSNDMASITEVAMRSLEVVRGERCQKKKQKKTSSLKL